jgi:hypothetical protein
MWINKPPTENGFYWVKTKTGITIAELDLNDSFPVHVIGDQYPYELHEISEWWSIKIQKP